MITLDKWYPSVLPKAEITSVAFEKAVEKVQEEYKQALKAHKICVATHELDIELYLKRARINTIELEVFSNRKGFEVFV